MTTTMKTFGRTNHSNSGTGANANAADLQDGGSSGVNIQPGGGRPKLVLQPLFTNSNDQGPGQKAATLPPPRLSSSPPAPGSSINGIARPSPLTSSRGGARLKHNEDAWPRLLQGTLGCGPPAHQPVPAPGPRPADPGGLLGQARPPRPPPSRPLGAGADLRLFKTTAAATATAVLAGGGGQPAAAVARSSILLPKLPFAKPDRQGGAPRGGPGPVNECIGSDDDTEGEGPVGSDEDEDGYENGTLGHRADLENVCGPPGQASAAPSPCSLSYADEDDEEEDDDSDYMCSSEAGDEEEASGGVVRMTVAAGSVVASKEGKAAATLLGKGGAKAWGAAATAVTNEGKSAATGLGKVTQARGASAGAGGARKRGRDSDAAVAAAASRVGAATATEGEGEKFAALTSDEIALSLGVLGGRQHREHDGAVLLELPADLGLDGDSGDPGWLLDRGGWGGGGLIVVPGRQ